MDKETISGNGHRHAGSDIIPGDDNVGAGSDINLGDDLVAAGSDIIPGEDHTNRGSDILATDHVGADSNIIPGTGHSSAGSDIIPGTGHSSAGSSPNQTKANIGDILELADGSQQPIKTRSSSVDCSQSRPFGSLPDTQLDYDSEEEFFDEPMGFVSELDAPYEILFKKKTKAPGAVQLPGQPPSPPQAAQSTSVEETDIDVDPDDAAQVRMFDLLRRLESYMGDLDVISFGGDDDFWDIPDSLNPRKVPAKPNYPHGQEVKEECMICFEHCQLRKRLCCDFPVCDGCMERYLETEVGQGIVKVPCISGQCSAFVFRDEILGRLPNSMKDKYYRFLVDANKDPKIKTCPRCSHIYDVDKQGSDNQAKYGVLVSCPECKMDWCFDCHAPWHSGIKCKDFRKGNKLLKTWAKEQHFGHHNAQRCPKCKIFIERKGGCDHMVCSKCNTSFCYRCGDRFCDLKFFGNHLSRYSPLGCKYNFIPERPVLRRVVRGSVFGAKLLGGLALLGIGVAAAGVLLGASVVILPAFGGYKYHKHRKMKRRVKRQQELFKMRTKNAMMEMYKEREQHGLERYEALARASLSNEHSDTVHIGIQTGQSQQVDVTVHNPYHSDALPQNDQTHNSEIRMNITDDRGKVTVTTAEITHNATSNDGSEAEIVLHVKTTYSSAENETKTENESEKNKDEHLEEGPGNTDIAENDSKSNLSESGPVSRRSRASSFTNRSSSLRNFSPKNSRRSIISKRWDTGSLKSGSKVKSENGSLSKKNKKAVSALKNNETGSQNAVTHPDQGQDENTTKSEESEHSSNTDQHSENESLSQSGCLLKLFSKKLNTLALQNQIEKEKEKQAVMKVSSEVKDIDISECPSIVSCTIEAELKRKDSELDSTDLDQGVSDIDKYLGLVSMETHTTPL